MCNDRAVDSKELRCCFTRASDWKMPVDHTMPLGQQSLVTWATPRLIEGKVKQIVDPKLKGKYPAKGFAKLEVVAASCMHHEAKLRPNMSIVVKVMQPLLKSPAPAPEI